ncbi:MAG: arginine repressor [Nitriliruptorales bacterium]|nr:arginine repressor [Nitriliruptorales bacterium]
MADRILRRNLIRELVSANTVTSQGELVALLSGSGVDATQATVSRDLEELGITKYRGADGRSAYVLPDGGGVAQMLRQFARTIDASGNLAVVRTPPGAAAAVGSAIDAADLPGVLATVQGDDTLLVVAREGVSGRQIADDLLRCKERRP